MQKYTVAKLKDLCRSLLISLTGNKRALFQRIWGCSSAAIEKINDERFYYRKKKGEDVAQFLPRWMILNPKPATSVDGVDMRRGAEEGFFGPTNVENAEGALKFQYACREEDRIHRPEFVSKIPDIRASNKGHISSATKKLLPKEIQDCHPKDFFDTQISPEFYKRCIVDTTNARVAAEGAGFGGSIYNDYKPQVPWSSVLEWPIPTSKDCHVV